MAQVLIPRPAHGYNLRGQTEYLLHRVVHEDTRGDASHASLNAADYQALLDQEPRELFGPSSDELVDRLRVHADNMRNDPQLQRCLRSFLSRGANYCVQTIKEVCRKLFGVVSSIWSGICVLLAFAMELSRQIATTLVRFICREVAAVIVEMASAWLEQNGGWQGVLSVAVPGLLDAMVQGIRWFFGAQGNPLACLPAHHNPHPLAFLPAPSFSSQPSPPRLDSLP